MKAMRKLLASAAVLGLLAMPAMAEQGVTDTEIVFGNILPFGAPNGALPSYANHYGIEVAVNEWNAKGGINGRKIVIKTEDDAYLPANTVQALRKLIDGGVFAMLATSAAGGTAASLPILEEQGIPTMVHFSPSDAAINPIKPAVFMLGASYPDTIYAQVKYILENKKLAKPKIGIIGQDDDYGAQLELAFRRAIDEFKIPYAEPMRFKRGQKDFGAEMLKVRAADVNILISGGISTEIYAMGKEGRKFNLPLEMATVSIGGLPPVVNLMKPLGYVYYTGDFVAPLGSPGTAHFEKLVEKYLDEKAKKTLNRYSTVGYAAAVVMFQAAELCGKDLTRTCVVDKLASGQKFDTNGLTGPISFSPTNHLAADAVQVIEVDPMKGTLTPVTEMKKY